ncbi:serine/threonine-protein kinase [Pseudonocardia sp. N23]|uniref:serine/threonine-protein kinase n=1 Tax=Pseudonocardia sp. N23 TaxID=1987376 RepID=UPI000BFD5FE6|nr:serine/threonine-protein kinase [Pseudonocardia sp. N23]GAY12194.1 putative serine/threonine protein kinase [Pseudonocardia sp. N23]
MSPPESDVRSEYATVRRIGNRYRLDERIAAGAMGAVWRGTDELLNRTVALKELLAAASPGEEDTLEESRQRILREGRIGARLQHPHVISMFDVVVHDDRPWLVMEYLPSRSFAAVLAEKGPMGAREAAAVGEQVADGLAAAHAAGVVHRDVKPGNVLIAENGTAKITDFGVSRAVDDVQLTRTGMIAGTPAFLAPEIARGGQPTAASDIFALGATLYTAVEGQPPFGLDDNAYALLHKVATGAVKPPSSAGELTSLLSSLLAPDPENRPTAGQARAALAAIAAGREPTGLPAGTAFATGAAAATTSAATDEPDADATRPATPAVTPAVVPPPRPGATPTLTTPPAPPSIASSAPSSAAGDGPSGDGGRRRPLVVAVVAVLAVLVVAAGVIIGLVRSSGDDTEQGALGGTSTASAAPPSAAEPTTTTPPPPTTTATTPGSGMASVEFVQQYYAMLPGDIDGAWNQLGPQAQAASGGLDRFRSFYSGLTKVWAETLRAVDADTVTATIVFLRPDGTTTREPYRFEVSGGPGSQKIESFTKTG